MRARPGMLGVVVLLACALSAHAEVSTTTASDEVVVSDGYRVSIELSIALPDNTVVGSTAGKEPLNYVHGRQQLLPGLERALTGMRPGDRKTVEMTPEEGFGPYDDQKRMRVARNLLPDTTKAGDVLRTPEGRPATVLAVEEEAVLVDLNHPLAGRKFMVDVTVVRIEPAP